MANNTKQVQVDPRPARTLFLVGLILFIGAGWAWWSNVANSPRNVFYSMLDNSLKSRSIGRHVTQDNGSQQLDQRMQYTLGQNAQASSVTVLSQGEGTSVKTQSIGTPTEDYVRYIDIKTDQTGASGQPLDFSHLLGIWGKYENMGSENETRGELFGENTLGVIPTGYLPYEERKDIIDLIRKENVYSVDFSKTKRETVNGRPQYTYEVEVNSENYITMLKQFARAIGLTQLENLDPAAFRESEPFKFTSTVDVWSRQLTGITFANSVRTEEYISHGSENSFTLPERTISIDELQARLQTLQ